MSLQVWLPFNGNTSNQGLNGLSMVGSPASWGNGKIGKCATFTGSTSNVIYNNTTELNYTDNFSFCLWVNQNYTGSTAQFAFTVGRADAGGFGYGLQILSSSTIGTWFGSRRIDFSCSANEWHHIALTVSGTTIKVYKDGALATTSTTATLPTYSDGNGLGLGCFHYSGDIYPYYGSINDFRIYNHCLSAKEVKEISKGLICHYLMNQPEQSPNLSTIPSHIPDFPHGAGTSVYSLSTDGISRRLTCTTAGSGGKYNGCFDNSVRLENTTYTWSIDIRASKNMTANIGLEGGGNAVFSLTTDWQRLSKTAVLLTNTYSAFVIYPYESATVGDWIEIKCLKVEKNNFSTPWSPCSSDYPKWSDNIEYDCSGYKNDGTKVGNITYKNNSIRYDGCYTFTGDDYIKIPKPLTISNSSCFTIAMWVKPESGCGNYSTILSNFNNPASGFWMAINTEGSGTWFYNGAYAKGDSLLTIGQWSHITMVFNAGTITWYTNGVATSTSNVSSRATAFTDYIAIGNSYTGTSWNTDFVGSISDVRIYSSVLSAEDIKALYNTSASVDKNGNMYAYEFKEE